VLLIGYGNPGRRDDGLGPAFAEAVERLAIPGLAVDAAYQLGIEDAADVAAHEVVLFADADASGPEPWSLRPLEPARETGFTTHSVSPAAVLGLARDLFGARTRGWLLGIRGYEFEEFGEGLTSRAASNLAAALERLAPALRGNDLDAAAAAGAAPRTPAAGVPDPGAAPRERRGER